MSETVIPCWSCSTSMTLDELRSADGYCPECQVDIDLAEYYPELAEEYDTLATRLAEAELERDSLAGKAVISPVAEGATTVRLSDTAEAFAGMPQVPATAMDFHGPMNGKKDRICVRRRIETRLQTIAASHLPDVETGYRELASLDGHAARLHKADVG